MELSLELLRQPSPAGAEGPLAEWLAEWLAVTGVEARVQHFAPGRANVLVGTDPGPAVAIYGHLDTTLSGDPAIDGPLTGSHDRVARPAVEDGILYGLGAGVAKGPTAAALVALLAARAALDGSGRGDLAAQVGALVVSGGTHRAVPPWPAPSAPGAGTGPAMGAGVSAALDGGFRPGAVICCKGGAPGLLYEEPGTLYLCVEVRDRYGPGLLRPPGDDLPGGPARLAALVEGIASWRRRHVADRQGRGGQLAAEVTLGALAAGMPAKPDMLPAAACAYVSVVTLPGDDEGQVASSLADHLRARDPGVDLRVEIYGTLPPGRTDPAHPIVEAVRSAWGGWTSSGDPPAGSGWRGSTEGALLRAAGVPTVRLGPPLRTDPADARREGVAVADLVSASQLWATALVAYVTSKDTMARSSTSGRNRSATKRSWPSLER